MENKRFKILWGVVIVLILIATVAVIAIYADRKLREKKADDNSASQQTASTTTSQTEEKAAADNKDETNGGEAGAQTDADKKNNKTNDDYLPAGCPHDPQYDPIMGDCGEDCNTDNWNVYTNKKYGYSFRYSDEFVITNSCKHGSCIVEFDGGDRVMLTGDLSDKGWPMVEVRHLSNEPYNPPAGTNEMEWIKKNFSWTKECFPKTANIYFTREDGHLIGGFNLYFPASPQAYSRREIYVNYKDKIFEIMMLDVDSPQARQFYNIWLSTFSLVGES